MIAGWQKARNQPVTGFLSAAQRQALLQEASTAVATYDEAQKKLETSPAAPTPAIPVSAAAPAPAPEVEAPASAPSGMTAFDGFYAGYVATMSAVTLASKTSRPLTLQVANGAGIGTLAIPGCGTSPFSLSIAPSGDVTGSGAGFANCTAMSAGSILPFKISGRAQGTTLSLSFTPNREKPYPAVLTRRGN
jgi:hypothetical protein